MLTKYIAKIIEFKLVPENKYENCLTRVEYEKQIRDEFGENKPDENGYIKLNPHLLRDTEYELFAGDKIIGIFKNENGSAQPCSYLWQKNNNPRNIYAYCILDEFEKDLQSHIDNKINNENLTLLKPIKNV